MKPLLGVVPAEYFVKGLPHLIPSVVGVFLPLIAGQQPIQLPEVWHDTLAQRGEGLLRHRCGSPHTLDKRLHLSHHLSGGLYLTTLDGTGGDILQHPEEC